MQLSPLRGLHQDCRVSMPPSSVERGGDEEQENLALSAFARLSQYQDRDRGSLAALSRQTPALAGNETVGARDSTAQASDILSNAGKSGATGGSPSRIKGNPLDTKSIFAGISGNRGATAEEIQQQNAPKTFVQKSFAKVKQGCMWLDASDTSCWVLPKDTRLRQKLMFLTSLSTYKNIVMFLVITNVIYMGVDDPTCQDECAEQNPTKKHTMEGIDLFYTIAFTVDVVLQAFSKNFIFGPGAYLKDGWGWLDFLTTASGYLQYLPLGSSNNLSGIRALRALRALRAINAVPGLKALVLTLLMSLPLLFDVLMLLAWIFAVFGIIGLQVFMGQLRGRCMSLQLPGDYSAGPPPPLSPDAPMPPDMLDILSGANSTFAPPSTMLTPDAGVLPPLPPLDLSSGNHRRSTLQLGTASFVQPVMAAIAAASATLFPGHGRKLLKGGGNSGGGTGGSTGGGGGEGTEIINGTLYEWVIVPGYEDTPCALHDAGMLQCPGDSICQWTDYNPNHGFTNFDNFGATALNIFVMLTLDNWDALLLYPLSDSMGPGIPTTFFLLLVLFGSYFAMQLLIAILSSKFAQLQAQQPSKRSRRPRKKRSQKPMMRQDTDDEAYQAALTTCQEGLVDPESGAPRSGLGGLRSRWQLAKLKVKHNCFNCWVVFNNLFLTPTPKREMRWWRRPVYDMCHQPWFGHIATGMVVANTLVFAMTYADQPDDYTAALEHVNLALTIGFIVEFTIKHWGLGYVRYWKDGWNVLDGLIVFISIIDLILAAVLSGKGGGSLQALRTFRVLRVLRSLRLLARIESLRRLMKLVVKGFVALKDFFLLLGIFIWIFAIIGMQQFGGEAAFSCENTSLCRSNFDTLWEALYTSFQVLTMDDWVNIAYVGMQAKGAAAALYFVLWVVIGNFILLTLFLAILINNFSDEPHQTQEEIEAELALQEMFDGASATSAGTSYHQTGDAASTIAGASTDGPALQTRVIERRQNKLDSALVRKMKMWLLMMGHDSGLTMGEAEALRERLDRDFNENPARFTHVTADYLHEDEILAAPSRPLPLPRSTTLKREGGGGLFKNFSLRRPIGRTRSSHASTEDDNDSPEQRLSRMSGAPRDSESRPTWLVTWFKSYQDVEGPKGADEVDRFSRASSLRLPAPSDAPGDGASSAAEAGGGDRPSGGRGSGTAERTTPLRRLQGWLGGRSMPARRSTSGLEAGDTQGQLTSSAAAGALKVSGQGGRANRKVQPSKGWLPTLLEPGEAEALEADRFKFAAGQRQRRLLQQASLHSILSLTSSGALRKSFVGKQGGSASPLVETAASGEGQVLLPAVPGVQGEGGRDSGAPPHGATQESAPDAASAGQKAEMGRLGSGMPPATVARLQGESDPLGELIGRRLSGIALSTLAGSNGRLGLLPAGVSAARAGSGALRTHPHILLPAARADITQRGDPASSRLVSSSRWAKEGARKPASSHSIAALHQSEASTQGLQPAGSSTDSTTGTANLKTNSRQVAMQKGTKVARAASTAGTAAESGHAGLQDEAGAAATAGTSASQGGSLSVAGHSSTASSTDVVEAGTGSVTPFASMLQRVRTTRLQLSTTGEGGSPDPCASPTRIARQPTSPSVALRQLVATLPGSLNGSSSVPESDLVKVLQQAGRPAALQQTLPSSASMPRTRAAAYEKESSSTSPPGVSRLAMRASASVPRQQMARAASAAAAAVASLGLRGEIVSAAELLPVYASATMVGSSLTGADATTALASRASEEPVSMVATDVGSPASGVEGGGLFVAPHHPATQPQSNQELQSWPVTQSSDSLQQTRTAQPSADAMQKDGGDVKAGQAVLEAPNSSPTGSSDLKPDQAASVTTPLAAAALQQQAHLPGTTAGALLQASTASTQQEGGVPYALHPDVAAGQGPGIRLDDLSTWPPHALAQFLALHDLQLLEAAAEAPIRAARRQHQVQQLQDGQPPAAPGEEQTQALQDRPQQDVGKLVQEEVESEEVDLEAVPHHPLIKSHSLSATDPTTLENLRVVMEVASLGDNSLRLDQHLRRVMRQPSTHNRSSMGTAPGVPSGGGAPMTPGPRASNSQAGADVSAVAGGEAGGVGRPGSGDDGRPAGGGEQGAWGVRPPSQPLSSVGGGTPVAKALSARSRVLVALYNSHAGSETTPSPARQDMLATEASPANQQGLPLKHQLLQHLAVGLGERGAGSASSANATIGSARSFHVAGAPAPGPSFAGAAAAGVDRGRGRAPSNNGSAATMAAMTAAGAWAALGLPEYPQSASGSQLPVPDMRVLARMGSPADAAVDRRSKSSGGGEEKSAESINADKSIARRSRLRSSAAAALGDAEDPRTSQPEAHLLSSATPTSIRRQPVGEGSEGHILLLPPAQATAVRGRGAAAAGAWDNPQQMHSSVYSSGLQHHHQQPEVSCWQEADEAEGKAQQMPSGCAPGMGDTIIRLAAVLRHRKSRAVAQIQDSAYNRKRGGVVVATKGRGWVRHAGPVAETLSRHDSGGVGGDQPNRQSHAGLPVMAGDVHLDMMTERESWEPRHTNMGMAAFHDSSTTTNSSPRDSPVLVMHQSRRASLPSAGVTQGSVTRKERRSVQFEMPMVLGEVPDTAGGFLSTPGGYDQEGVILGHKKMPDAEEEEARLDELAKQLSKEDGIGSEEGERWPRGRRYLAHSSMFVFSPQNRWRLMVSDLVEHKHFTNFILLLILASAINLALESPRLEEDDPIMVSLSRADIVYTSMFALEMVLKMFAKGLVLHPNSYFRTGWDILDCVIVATSILSMTDVGQKSKIVRTLRLLRVLRPLRLLRQWKGMQLVVETLISSIPSVANVLLFGAFLFGIFAILGVQLFAGRMARCNQAYINGTLVEWRDDCVPGTFICTVDDLCPNPGEEVERWWSRPFRNFDNIGNAMLSLFTLATLDAFMELARQCIDSVGVDNQPKPKNAPWLGLYVIAFILLGSWFWVNLLVSVVVEYYTKLVQERGDILMSKQAKEYVKLFKFSAAKGDYWKTIPAPTNCIRAVAYKIVSHPRFDHFIMFIIMANVTVMACDHYGGSDEFQMAMTVLNFLFTSIFIVEMCLKLLAMGPKEYFGNNWNRLDFFIIMVSIPDLISEVVPALKGISFMTIFRVFRVARMFKLINKAKGLRTLFNTLITSAPAIFNVGSLLFLVMFIFAVLSMNIFGGSDRFDNEPHANFNNFGTSLLTLFRVFTADGWQDVMLRAFGCDEMGYRCDMVSGVSIAAGFIFPFFVLFATFVMLNLVIAVIIDNFIESAQSEGLLKTNNFVDLLKMVITLKVVVKMLRIKIEAMKERDAAKRKARALLEEMAIQAAGGTGGGPGGGPPALGPAVLPGHSFTLANGSADAGVGEEDSSVGPLPFPGAAPGAPSRPPPRRRGSSTALGAALGAALSGKLLGRTSDSGHNTPTGLSAAATFGSAGLAVGERSASMQRMTPAAGLQQHVATGPAHLPTRNSSSGLGVSRSTTSGTQQE